jgi:hypothetical protein
MFESSQKCNIIEIYLTEIGGYKSHNLRNI